jgi:tripartite-type tricarboxylate transporter receptor subunit TctC
MSILNRRDVILAGASFALSMTCARAAAYPERPLTIVVPYAAGGAGDTIMRVLSQALERELGQPLVIEARSGGGGNIGAHAVANAAPDGYTLMLGAANNFVINQFMLKGAVDPFAAFALITKVADVPSVLYTHPSVPATTLAAFIAYAKANPGKLNYASPSVGTTPHLAVERLKQLTGIQLTHIPYRGAPPAMQALLTNDVQLYLAGWGVGRAHVEAGRIRALAVASEKRLPDVAVPTAAESGVADYVASNWWGLAAPRGTPDEVIDKVRNAFVAALADPTVVQKLGGLGFVPASTTPQSFLDSAKAEAAVWATTIRDGKLANE